MNSKPAPSGILPYSHTDWWRRPQAHDRPALHWHIATRAFALAMWAVPRRLRFGAVKALSRALAPLVRRTPWYHRQRRLRIDGVNEIALHYTLSILANSGALFDPDMSIEGAEKLDAALKKGRGVLVIAPHALLSLLLFRYLYDRGCVPTVISVAPFVHIYGRRLVARAIHPSRGGMFSLRSMLRSEGVVCAMIDKQSSATPRTIEVTTTQGPIYISDSLIRFAERCEAKVIFTAVRVDSRRGVVLTFEAPQPAPSINVETITKDFARFVQGHVDRDSAPII